MTSMSHLIRSALLPPARRAAARRLFVVAGAAAAFVVAGSAYAENADPVVARVNGSEIKSSDLAIAEEELGGNLPAMTADKRRDALVAYVSDMILAAKAAEEKKIPDDAEFKRRLTYMRNKLLMETMLQAEVKSAVTDAAMQKVYEDAKKQMSGEKEVHARHILVESEDEAKAILAELKKGTDFAELARLKSKDPGAASEGGDLGYFTKDQMVPEFAEAALKLDKGQLSDPIKTQFGWHIIRVEDKRDRAIPPFEQVKDQIETFVTRKAQQEVVAKLRAAAKIERVDAPAAAGQSPGTAGQQPGAAGQPPLPPGHPGIAGEKK
jgi:peptidyl-prolyl cis-trans isomerase C